MKRTFLCLGAWALVLAPSAFAQSPEELSRTAAYLASFQNHDGGFAAKPGGPSSLGSTSSAIRSLKYVGGSIPDVLGCVKYVKSCYNESSGGFAPTPDGTPDVRTTAIGLMAITELKIPADKMAEGAIKFFSQHVKGFEDVRIAVAGLEAVDRPSPDFEKWTKLVEEMRNPDGTFGKGSAQARDTGGAAVALLRMGVKLDKREAALAALRAGQRPDGAWSRDGGESDLEASYRIMRCFYMLNEPPDLDRLRGFIARCRHSDGGYSVKPGGAPDLSGTYYASIISRWAKLLGGEPALVETVGFEPLFNGRDLTGWEGDTSLWSARAGMIVGTSKGLKHNDFLATNKSYGDFIFKATFRMVGSEASNSGIQFRSVRVKGHEMSGYQADIGQGYWGCLYDESRRNKVLVRASDAALKKVHKSGWNEYVIRAMGNHIQMFLNGVRTLEYRETDPAIARSGRIAFQIHAGGPMEIQFKDLYIQALPEPTTDRMNEPGFHLRTVKVDDQERKYSVFVPNGYDGTKSFPVVLFLHGSGERGDDGVRSAQVGLGAAIHGHPDDYPFLAVFPQARKTWRADSEDIKEAIAALDDVLKGYKADRERVVLTGLSMGGSGSWGLAAEHPDRFVAVVPVCGNGRTETVSSFRDLPVWSFVGDADSNRTVLNTREMTLAIRAGGGRARETEYRGVGHNSWDRAYNSRALIEWMLAQTRK